MITKAKFHVPGISKMTTAVRTLCIVFFLAAYKHSSTHLSATIKQTPPMEDTYFLLNSVETLRL